MALTEKKDMKTLIVKVAGGNSNTYIVIGYKSCGLPLYPSVFSGTEKKLEIEAGTAINFSAKNTKGLLVDLPAPFQIAEDTTIEIEFKVDESAHVMEASWEQEHATSPQWEWLEKRLRGIEEKIDALIAKG